MIQILDSNRKPSFGQKFSNAVGVGLQGASQLYQQHQEKEAISKALGPEAENLPRDFQKMAYENKLKNQQLGEELQGKKALLLAIEEQRGLPPGSLSGFLHKPELAEQVTRPAKETKKTQASQPIDPEQLSIMEKVRNTEGFNDLDEVDQYRMMTRAGVSKENAAEEAKLTGSKLERKQKGFESSYKAQEDFINKTTDSYKGFETEMKPRLLQMKNIPDEDLIGPTSAVFLDSLGIPLGALENPASELYDKLSQDLLKGLPETYGSRILKVEVDNFLKTIPRLMNSPDGRRMIASNMLKLGEMKEVYYNEMRRQQKDSIDNEKNLPRDFQQRVFDQVKPQVDRINNEFVKLSEITSIPDGTIPFFGPDGQISFVPKEHAQWAVENGGKRVW